ncbi:hypothetical protein PG988_007474 [Apiospora saccharicola]
MSTGSSSDDSQGEAYSIEEHSIPRSDENTEDEVTDGSEPESSSGWLSIYDGDLSLDLTGQPEPVDTSLEHFKSILRPIETAQTAGYVFPWSTGAAVAPKQVHFPNVSNTVLSLESPVLGTVDINKGCFELIRLHCNRHQQLKDELDKLRKERQGLDAELLCRGDDIAYYKREIDKLKAARHD